MFAKEGKTKGDRNNFEIRANVKIITGGPCAHGTQLGGFGACLSSDRWACILLFFLNLFLVAGKSFLQAFCVRIEQVGITEGPDVAHIVHTGPQICTFAMQELAASCMWRMKSAEMEVSGG